ncbi:hypothetical protein [Streptomyces sp. NPDC006879]|uniref:hypothetical protein n=1 Tax=Streptomyces sp. NPDC006879 TaxID=3364767 RepID=UPI0036B0F168
MSEPVVAPVIVFGVMPGDPPFRIVQINGDPVGVAYDMVDVIRIADQAGFKHVDLDDPAFVRWLGGGKYRWTV